MFRVTDGSGNIDDVAGVSYRPTAPSLQGPKHAQSYFYLFI